MDKPLTIIVSSFLISLLVTPLIIRYSVKRRLFVVPEKRRIHKRITPSLGGIGIFIGFLISSLIFSDTSALSEVKFVLLFASLIFLLGIIDDLLNLPASQKLIGQLLIIIAFILMSDIRLASLHGLFGIGQLPYGVSFSLTVVVMVIIINSLNLIDGIDGLASIIALLSSLTFAGWFSLTGESAYAMLLFALFGGVAAFILFNWEPSRIFMGDTGSLVIGMILAIASIKFINVNLMSPEMPYGFSAPIATALCFVSIPLLDTTRIIILRLSKRQSPLKPDKNHIHHTLLKLGLTHSQVSLFLGLGHAMYILLAILFRDLQDRFLLPAMVLFSTVLCVFLDNRARKHIAVEEAD